MTKIIILPALITLMLDGYFVVQPMPRTECEHIIQTFEKGHPYSAGTDSIAVWMRCADVWKRRRNDLVRH